MIQKGCLIVVDRYYLNKCLSPKNLWLFTSLHDTLMVIDISSHPWNWEQKPLNLGRVPKRKFHLPSIDFQYLFPPPGKHHISHQTKKRLDNLFNSTICLQKGICQLAFRIYNIHSRIQRFKHSTFVSFTEGIHNIPSSELTYPTWGKGKSLTQKCLSMGPGIC